MCNFVNNFIVAKQLCHMQTERKSLKLGNNVYNQPKVQIRLLTAESNF